MVEIIIREYGDELIATDDDGSFIIHKVGRELWESLIEDATNDIGYCLTFLYIDPSVVSQILPTIPSDLRIVKLKTIDYTTSKIIKIPKMLFLREIDTGSIIDISPENASNLVDLACENINELEEYVSYDECCD